MRAKIMSILICTTACCWSGASYAADNYDVCGGGFATPTARLAACNAILTRAKLKGTIAVESANKGSALYLLHRYDEALDAFDVAVDFDHKNIIFLLGRADTLRAMGRVDQANKDYEKVLQQRPQYAEDVLAQAKSLSMLKRTDEAIAKYGEALAKKPKMKVTIYSAHMLRGMGYLQKATERGEYLDIAVGDFSAAIDVAPIYAAYYARATAYDRLHRYADAIADLAKALELEPSNAVALNAKCWIEAKANVQLDQALSECSKAVESNASSNQRAAWLDSRGLVYFRLGRWAESIADYDAALKADPKIAPSLYMRGIAKRRSGEVSAGDQDLAAAEILDSHIGEQFVAIGVTP